MRIIKTADGGQVAIAESDRGTPCVHLVPDGEVPCSTLEARSRDGVVRLYCTQCEYSRDLPMRFASSGNVEPPEGWR